MGLSMPIDRTPTNALAITSRWHALDPRIRNKLGQLEARKDSLHGALDALRRRLLARHDDLAALRRALARDEGAARPAHVLVTSGPSVNGGGTGVGAVTVGGPVPPERRQEIDRVAEEVARLEGHYRSAEPRWQLAARIYQDCCAWLETTPIGAVVPIVVPLVRVADARAEVAAIREQLAVLASEAQAITVAPVPLIEALARLEEQRKNVAERVAGRRANAVAAFFSPGGGCDIAGIGLRDGFGAVAREVADAIRHAAEERFLADVPAWREAIEAHPLTGAPIPAAERPRRLADLVRQRATLERREEQLVLAAEHDDIELDRRTDSSAAVVVCTVLADTA